MRGRVVRELGWTCPQQQYLKWTTNKDLLYSKCNSAQFYMAAWMGAEFAGKSICIHTAGSLLCSPDTITLLISFILLQNKKLRKKVNI